MKARRPLSDEEEERRYDAYLSTITDKESAARLGMQKAAFRQWRRRHHLPSRSPGDCKKCRRSLYGGNRSGLCKQCGNQEHGAIWLEIGHLRSKYARLVRMDPATARDYREAMRREEGEAFTRLALDGILSQRGRKPPEDASSTVGV